MFGTKFSVKNILFIFSVRRIERLQQCVDKPFMRTYMQNNVV